MRGEQGSRVFVARESRDVAGGAGKADGGATQPWAARSPGGVPPHSPPSPDFLAKVLR